MRKSAETFDTALWIFSVSLVIADINRPVGLLVKKAMEVRDLLWAKFWVGTLPLLVLAVRDRAVTTSSTRVRRWRVDGVGVHHLIDPRTGLPAEGGLQAVTGLGDDPADAEVAAKGLFIEGIDGMHDKAAAAARWVLDSGRASTGAPP